MIPSVLTYTQRAVLEILAQSHFVTEAQLGYWVGKGMPTISKALHFLSEARLVSAQSQVRPMIWHLTHMGSRVTGTALPAGRRHPSWSVMAHACHVNQTEIYFRSRFPKFRFFSRGDLMKMGLNPAHGEHAGIAEKEFLFILIDDYLMGSDRISWSLIRPHKRNVKYCPEPIQSSWKRVLNQLMVISTDKAQAESHQKWIEKKGISGEIIYVPALWRS